MLREWTLSLFYLALIASPSFADAAAIAPVQQTVDLALFSGKWFEISRIENEFQIGCRGTTATYTAETDPKNNTVLDVSNECWVGDENQKRIKTAHGRAWPEKGASNARLKISFVHFGVWWKIFANDYWILELGPVSEAGQYSWVLVGHPKRRYAWIMSRTPSLETSVFDEIMTKATAFGYNRKDFRQTDQAMNLK